jgi:hypothetical protein
MKANIEAEINRAARLGAQLEHLVYNKAEAGKLVVRAGVVLAGTPEDVQKIRSDNFVVNFKKDGALIDKALNLGTLTDNFLKQTRELLHSLTHSGTAQLGMRFDGKQIGATISDRQIRPLLAATSGVSFLITIAITKHFNFKDEANVANKLFAEYGKHGAVL